MAKKKSDSVTTTTYLVMVHSDGRPTEVLLPDGRLALLVPEADLYPCTRAQVITGVVHRPKTGNIEILSDELESIEDIREAMIFDGDADPRKVRAMKIEHHPLISFT
jgi:hypothetical protein